MPYILKTICCICKELISVQSLPKKPLMDTSHGFCDICGPKWHEEQLVEALPLIEKMKEEDDLILEIYDEDLNKWVPLNRFKENVPLPGTHEIEGIINIVV